MKKILIIFIACSTIILCFAGCKKEFPPQIKVICFDEMVKESKNIFIGTVAEMADSEAIITNQSNIPVSPYAEILPVKIFISETLKGDIQSNREIERLLPINYAGKLQTNQQYMFMTDHKYPSVGVVFGIIKIQNNAISPMIELKEVEKYADAVRAYQEAPKTLEEAKQQIKGIIELS